VHAIVIVLIGFAIGSLPFGYAVARRRGVDLRRSGSGNVGATNAYRTVGLAIALAVMAFDVAKGAGAVLVALRLGGGSAAPAAAGVAAILGHMYPPWLGFRGGKGVATATGVFAMLAPWAVLVAAGAFVVTVWMTRYVSLGSVVACAAVASTTALFDAPVPVVVAGFVAAAVIVGRHRANLARFVAGTERRIGQRA